MEEKDSAMQVEDRENNKQKRGFEWKSIKTKLLVIIIIMFIAGGVSFTLIASLMATDALEKSAIGTLMAVGDGSSSKLELTNAAGQDLVTMLALRPNIVNILAKHHAGTSTNEDIHAGVREIADIHDATSNKFNRINILDNNGIVVLSNIPENIGLDFSHLGFFIHREEVPYTSDPFIGTDGELYLGYGSSIFYDGQEVGLATIGVRYQAIDEIIFDHATLGEESIIFVVDEGGTIFSGIDGNYSVFYHEKIDMSIFEGENTLAHAPDYYGRDAVIFKEPVQNTPWYIIASKSVDTITAPIMKLVTLMVLSLLTFLLITACIAFIVAERLAHPIQSLTHHAHQLAAGDVDVEITHTGIDEIGQLANSFRAIASNMKENAEYASKVAAGDVNFEITLASDRDLEGKSLMQMRDTLSRMVDSLQILAQRSGAGDLSYHADADKFHGVYRELILTLNKSFSLIIIPLQETMRLSTSYSNGDYSDRFNPDLVVKGDFVPFRDALNCIGIQTSDTLLKIQDEIHHIVTGMEEVNGSIEDIANAVSMLAESSTRVSSFAEQNDQDLEQTLIAMNDLANTVGAVAQHASSVSELADHASHLSYEGLQRAEVAERGMADIMASFDISLTMVAEILNRMEEIGSIVDIISSISEQTNLLALNAAIEAARAGDAGRGFAVVADEVKSLARDSHRSAEHIGIIIGNLQQITKDVAIGMQRDTDVVTRGNHAVTETIAIFNQMAEASRDVNRNISEVAAASEEQAASVQEVTASMTEIRDMVRETAREATDSAAASEEINAAVSQVHDIVNEATRGTIAIVDQVSKFHIK